MLTGLEASPSRLLYILEGMHGWVVSHSQLSSDNILYYTLRVPVGVSAHSLTTPHPGWSWIKLRPGLEAFS
ncbi:hypothetical protein GGP50_003251 [Salinibacter ruber]|nr:hypothetical protein [Salinibacter ruber]